MKTPLQIIEKLSKNPESFQRLLRMSKGKNGSTYRPESENAFSGILMHTKLKGTAYVVRPLTNRPNFQIEMAPVKYVQNQRTYIVEQTKYHNWNGTPQERIRR
jgi:hypothetical protein